MKDIAIYGAGGLGREIAALIGIINRTENCWNFVGFFDDGKPMGEKNDYGSILGGIEQLNHWNKPLSIVICIGNSQAIQGIVDSISNPLIDYPNIIAPDIVYMDPQRITMGKGNVIQHFTLLSVDVSMGDFNIFNCRTNVGHDVVIGSYNLFMPCVTISGGVSLGNGNFLGAGATVLQYIKIGTNVRIAANSLILRNTRDNQLYVGNPATVFKS